MVIKMAIFDYKCLGCGTKTEIHIIGPVHPAHLTSKNRCAKCGSLLERQVTAASFKIDPATPRGN